MDFKPDTFWTFLEIGGLLINVLVLYTSLKTTNAVLELKIWVLENFHQKVFDPKNPTTERRHM